MKLIHILLVILIISITILETNEKKTVKSKKNVSYKRSHGKSVKNLKKKIDLSSVANTLKAAADAVNSSSKSSTTPSTSNNTSAANTSTTPTANTSFTINNQEIICLNKNNPEYASMYSNFSSNEFVLCVPASEIKNLKMSVQNKEAGNTPYSPSTPQAGISPNTQEITGKPTAEIKGENITTPINPVRINPTSIPNSLQKNVGTSSLTPLKGIKSTSIKGIYPSSMTPASSKMSSITPVSSNMALTAPVSSSNLGAKMINNTASGSDSKSKANISPEVVTGNIIENIVSDFKKDKNLMSIFETTEGKDKLKQMLKIIVSKVKDNITKLKNEGSTDSTKVDEALEAILDNPSSASTNLAKAVTRKARKMRKNKMNKKDKKGENNDISNNKTRRKFRLLESTIANNNSNSNISSKNTYKNKSFKRRYNSSNRNLKKTIKEKLNRMISEEAH